MNELEMEIGRTLGSSAFFIFQYIKHNPGATQMDIAIETGLSRDTVSILLKNLEDTKTVFYKLKEGKSRTRVYRPNEAKETWKFH